MKKVIFVTIVIPLLIFAQEGWFRSYGSGKGHHLDCSLWVEAAEDGGYITVGRSNEVDMAVMRLDENGDTLWSRRFWRNLENSYVAANCIKQTSDGGFIVVGDRYAYEETDLLLLKIDTCGDSLWSQVYNGGGGLNVQVTEDGGFVVAGFKGKGSPWGREMWPDNTALWLLKTDSLGDTIWSRTYKDGEFSAVGCEVQKTIDDGYAIVGHLDQGYDDAIWLLRTDEGGDILWSSKIGGLGWDRGFSMDYTTDGGFVITGSDGTTEPYGLESLWVIRTDSIGNILWDKVFYEEDGGNSVGFLVRQTSDKGYIVTGKDANDGVKLIKLDSTGNEIWTRTYTTGEEGYCVQELSDGYIVSGHTRVPYPKHFWFLIKCNWAGEVPVTVSPTMIYSPEEGWALYKVKPRARFINFASDSSAVDFCCHCEIVDINDSTFTYHDSVLVGEPLEPWVSNWEPHFVDVTFAEWTAPSISDFRATFYTTEAGNGQPMFVDFRWTGIEEPPYSENHPTFSVVTGLGSCVLLSTQSEERLQLNVFDASGRLADEVVLDGPGTVSWPVTPDGFSPGVYFIRETSGQSPVAKVIFVR